MKTCEIPCVANVIQQTKLRARTRPFERKPLDDTACVIATHEHTHTDTQTLSLFLLHTLSLMSLLPLRFKTVKETMVAAEGMYEGQFIYCGTAIE